MTAVVLDASAVVEYLRGSAAGRRLALALGPDPELHIPHLCVVEVTSALRTLALRGDLAADRARAALEDLIDLPAERHDAEPLLPRIWQLRETVTAYDATYLALAEALNARLFTADTRLARSPGHHVVVDAWPASAQT